MKKILLGATLVAIAHLHGDAQWTYDPENPQLVSNGICTQYSVQQVADENGGTFVFWMDSRMYCFDNTYYDVYAQHYDASGNELWEPGGREIINLASSVQSYSVMRPSSQEGIIIGFHTRAVAVATDSLWFQKLNDDGVQLWANDLLIAEADGCEGNYFLGIENFSFIKNGDDYTVNLTPTYCGGSDGCRITHFSTDGVLTGVFNGEPEGNQSYIGSRGIDMTYDGTGDTYLYYTGGNGAGAHAFVMRVTLNGDSAFAPIDVLEGTNGLNYQYAAMSDEDGIAVCFQSTGEGANTDIFMRKLNGDGTWAWDGNTIEVCTFDGAQGNFHWVQDDTYYYIVWADGRPGVIGNSAIYAQKIEKATGAIQWLQDGIEVFDQNTYIPYPKCVLTDEGKLVVTNEGIGEFGFNAQMVNQAGTLDWPATSEIGILQYSPFYSDYVLLQSNETTIVAWSKSNPSGGADGIYIANVAAPVTFIEETISVCNSCTVNGVEYTESDTYLIELPGDTLLTLNLTVTIVEAEATLFGTMLVGTEVPGGFSFIDCDSGILVSIEASTFTPFETGNYAFIVEDNGCADTTDCFFIEIIGVEEVRLQNHIALFPNPGGDVLNILSQFPLKNATLNVTEMNGKILLTKNSLSGLSFGFDMNQFENGIYLIEVFVNGSSSRMKWVKT
ncbi:MAG: T9SS type A sorting domain-containing protein [Flavobacteriales bacterium]